MSRTTVPFLRSLGCIPVYKGDYDHMVDTLRLSMDVLRQSKFLLVFPEDNLLPADPQTKLKPFQRSFARLGEMYYQETGERLEFYPVTVHPSGVVMVGRPVAYDPLNALGLERHRHRGQDVAVVVDESNRAGHGRSPNSTAPARVCRRRTVSRLNMAALRQTQRCRRRYSTAAIIAG